MKCDEFRRKLLEDPGCADPDFITHREQCPECAREAESVERMDGDLAKLLRVEPPAELKGRLRRPARRRVPLALAASLVALMALAAVVWPLISGDPVDRMIAEVFDHMGHEPDALDERPPLSTEEVRRVSTAVTLDSDGLGFPVTYAMPCSLLWDPGLHLVVRAEEGPVTVLVFTRARISEPLLVRDGPYRAALRPLGSGSLAVVGDPGQPVEALADGMAALVQVGG